MKKFLFALLVFALGCFAQPQYQTPSFPIDSLIRTSNPFKGYRTSASYHFAITQMDLFPFFAINVPRPNIRYEGYYKDGSYMYDRDGEGYLLIVPVKSYWQSNPKIDPDVITYTILFFRKIEGQWKQNSGNITISFQLVDREKCRYAPKK